MVIIKTLVNGKEEVIKKTSLITGTWTTLSSIKGNRVHYTDHHETNTSVGGSIHKEDT